MNTYDAERPWNTLLLFPSWRIKGLLIADSPVMDTGQSGNRGMEGLVYFPKDREGMCTRWSNSMGTSMTWGTGLDLRDRPGQRRALDWMDETECKFTPIMPMNIEDAIALGQLVQVHADSYDPYWRVRYTPAWWKANGAYENYGTKSREGWDDFLSAYLDKH
jgi:hypothetical protein